MPPKSNKSDNTLGCYTESYDDYSPIPRTINIEMTLSGDPPGQGEWPFLVILNGQTYIDAKWNNGIVLETSLLPLDLSEPYWQAVVADKPLILLLRTIAGKGVKDPDPLLNADNRAGASIDLYPLLAGEEEIFLNVPLYFIETGEITSCVVEIQAKLTEMPDVTNAQIPLVLTMISAHCMPLAKEGTVYLGAIGLNDVLEPCAVNFGKSLSTATANKIVWASASNIGKAASTSMNTSQDDKFIPQDLSPQGSDECNNFYWNAMKRVLVDPVILRNRLSAPFFFEMAGVPKMGKIEVRGRYMAFVDARALLEPGQISVTTCAKLKFYAEAEIPENVDALIELPPTSAKPSARDVESPVDEFGHESYIFLRFDLADPLVPRLKMITLYETIGLIPPDGPSFPVDELNIEPPPESPLIDVKKIRKEGGALAVHKELSGLACRGAIPMNQGIKRTAANKLLMRVRAMLKQFPPGDCSYLDWQDTVTGQHAASRRAVTASFAPQPPPVRISPVNAVARCRMVGDERIANVHINNNMKWAGRHPRSLICKALRCLEQRCDIDAKNYILEGLSVHPRNKYLLWMYGAQEFNNGSDAMEAAVAAFRIAGKGDYSDGTSNAIGWAALHALHDYNGDYNAAFVTAKRMRKSYELPREWKKFVQRWVEISGEEEIFWIPAVISESNPLLIAAAFFLCLRCFKFSECLLNCVDNNCATRGSRFNLVLKNTVDTYYVRAASLILRKNFDLALELVTKGTKIYGPTAIMAQLRVSCLACLRGWDGECVKALKDAEKSGSDISPAILLRAAIGGIKSNPSVSLQRAARAHKIVPSAQTAVTIARIYMAMGEEDLAERWASAAVKTESLLADGWGVLAILAMRGKNIEKARTMLRTAKQIGPMSPELEEDVNKFMDTLHVRALPDYLVQNLCFCEHFDE